MSMQGAGRMRLPPHPVALQRRHLPQVGAPLDLPQNQFIYFVWVCEIMSQQVRRTGAVRCSVIGLRRRCQDLRKLLMLGLSIHAALATHAAPAASVVQTQVTRAAEYFKRWSAPLVPPRLCCIKHACVQGHAAASCGRPPDVLLCLPAVEQAVLLPLLSSQGGQVADGGGAGGGQPGGGQRDVGGCAGWRSCVFEPLGAMAAPWAPPQLISVLPCALPSLCMS